MEIRAILMREFHFVTLKKLRKFFKVTKIKRQKRKKMDEKKNASKKLYNKNKKVEEIEK